VDGRDKPGHDSQTEWLMHDIRWIRENADVFVRGLELRGASDSDTGPLLDRLIKGDADRRSTIVDLEQAQKKLNDISREIGKAAKLESAGAALAGLRGNLVLLKEKIKGLEQQRDNLERALRLELLQIPNLPLDEVPHGRDARDNVERHRFGVKRGYTFGPKQHFDLGEALGQMDFEAAAKLSGARFVVLKKGLARLERALGQFFLDVHTSEPHNYTEVAPPLLVRDEAMLGTAQLPKFSNDQFRAETEEAQRRHAYENFENARAAMLDYVEKRGVDAARKEELGVLGFVYELIPERRWLIPTAEVPLTNLVRESILDEVQLPLRYTACTPCFRAEAGAAGKDTRGMIRQHQFTKVELVSITTPEQSKDEHERMLACAEEVLKKLELHYRVMTLCTGDMGFASQKTFDIEVWLPGQNMYREISSCSICGEFQARRMNARYRTKEGRNVRHVHTLNGSGVAVGRALIAVMENYQQENGSIAVPEALAPYMGGLKTIAKGE
jgi:seryl-tRNA synthetase